MKNDELNALLMEALESEQGKVETYRKAVMPPSEEITSLNPDYGERAKKARKKGGWSRFFTKRELLEDK